MLVFLSPEANRQMQANSRWLHFRDSVNLKTQAIDHSGRVSYQASAHSRILRSQLGCRGVRRVKPVPYRDRRWTRVPRPIARSRHRIYLVVVSAVGELRHSSIRSATQGAQAGGANGRSRLQSSGLIATRKSQAGSWLVRLRTPYGKLYLTGASIVSCDRVRFPGKSSRIVMWCGRRPIQGFRRPGPCAYSSQCRRDLLSRRPKMR